MFVNTVPVLQELKHQLYPKNIVSISLQCQFICFQPEEVREDYSHLPPNQQKKQLMQKIDTLKASLAKEMNARYFIDVVTMGSGGTIRR